MSPRRKADFASLVTATASHQGVAMHYLRHSTFSNLAWNSMTFFIMFNLVTSTSHNFTFNIDHEPHHISIMSLFTSNLLCSGALMATVSGQDLMDSAVTYRSFSQVEGYSLDLSVNN